MPPPSSKKAALGKEQLLVPSNGGRYGQLAPAGTSAGGLDKKEKSFTYLWDASCSKTQQDIEEPVVSLLKFKGIPGTDSSIFEESRRNLTNTTANFPFEKHTGENRGALLLSVKGTSSEDPLCHCVVSTKTDGNADAIKDERAVRSTNVAKQLFVKVCQKKVSIQKDFNNTTIKELIVSACHKVGIQSCDDFYATYGVKRLKDDKPIACYPIFKDSTVHLTSRLRGGREYTSVTFEALMNQNMNRRFHHVGLSSLSQTQNSSQSSVTFLSEFSSFYIHRILVYVCGTHRKGRSFDGHFSAKDILIINKTMVDFHANVRDNYNFSASTCSNDYMSLYNIFRTFFTQSGIDTPKYFNHFMNYLLKCPAKGDSNTEPLIKFLTNHPAITSYNDRIKQCQLLDSMIHRLDANERTTLGRGGMFRGWVAKAQSVPALRKVYQYDAKYDAQIHRRRVINSDYTLFYLGCLHFSKNYFSHADYQMKLPEVEAAFACELEEFLPEILYKVAKEYKLPANFDKLTLLGNPLADSSELLSISYPAED